MKNNVESEELAKKAIDLFLTVVGANSVADAQLALNKLVAVATDSVQTLVDVDASVFMLDSIKANALLAQKANHYQALNAHKNSVCKLQ